MDESRLLGRLDRIGALDRTCAPPGELLAELRGLLREAEEQAREQAATVEVGEGGGRALRTAPAGDIIGM